MTYEQRLQRAKAALRRAYYHGPEARKDEIEGVSNTDLARLFFEVLTEIRKEIDAYGERRSEAAR